MYFADKAQSTKHKAQSTKYPFMTSRLNIIRLPVLITLGLAAVQFILEATGPAGSTLINISWFIPIIAIWLTMTCLRNDRGYGGFISSFLLYTVAVRLPVILLTVIGKTTDLGEAYFTYGRNLLFGLVLPHVILWPVASLMLGTLLWPVIALIMKGRQVSYRGAVSGVVVILLLIFVGLPYVISTLYTGGIGGRRSAHKTPDEHQIAYEDITLTTSDGLKIQGWYLPNETGRGTIIYCHGLFNQRSEMIDQAAFMHEQGYRGLLFDFRRHGKSDGDLTSFGYYERRDVEAALRYAIDERGETGPVILWGISMGAANTLLAAAEQPEVDAVIAESSFYSVSETLAQDLGRMFRLPQFPFADIIELITEIRLGIDIGDLHIGRAAAKIHNRPILLVGGTADTRMPIRNNERLYADIQGPMKDQLIVEGATHGDIWEMATEAYNKKVISFLEQHNLLIPIPAEASISPADE
jgi:pimeloyl-ACP methyl ester carboxylesterase